MSKFALLVALVALFVVSSFASCSYTSPSGKYYDFSNGKEISAILDSDYTYTFSFCKLASDASCAQHGGNSCLLRNKENGFLYALGKWNDKEGPVITEGKEGGLVLAFANGDKSPNTATFALTVNMDCGKTPKMSVTSSVVPKIVYSLVHPSACPTTAGLSAGAIFLIVVLGALALYFLVGFLICKFKFQRPGLQAIPNNEFWCALPGLFTAGIKFIISKITGKGGAATSEYSEDYATYGSTEQGV